MFKATHHSVTADQNFKGPQCFISREKCNIILIGTGCNIHNCVFTVVSQVTSNVQTLSCKHGDVYLRHQVGVEAISVLLPEALLSHTPSRMHKLCVTLVNFLHKKLWYLSQHWHKKHMFRFMKCLVKLVFKWEQTSVFWASVICVTIYLSLHLCALFKSSETDTDSFRSPLH